MKLVIVDDEPLARARLRRMLEQLPEYRVLGEAGDGASALQQVRAGEPDIVLLDIHMPGMDGLQAAAELAQLPLPPALIFTTAYVEHALAAHNLGVAGYLLKPISHEDLAAALARARRLSQAQLRGLAGAADAGPRAGAISARTNTGVTRVPLAEVVCFLADQKWTRVCHFHGEVLIEDSLNTLERRHAAHFLRVHRSALVARRFIMVLENGDNGQMQLRMRHLATAVPVSRRRLAAVRQFFSAHSDD